MQVKSIAECSKGSILQYFWPSLSYHFPLRPLFCLFLSGCLRQVLLYINLGTLQMYRENSVKNLEYNSEALHIYEVRRTNPKLQLPDKSYT